MKAKLFLFASAVTIAAAAGLSSCNSDSSLARSLVGEWSGTPENIADNNAITATLIESLTFGEPSMTDKTTGELTVNGIVSATTQLVADTTLTEPVTVSAGAIVSVSATWKVIDDDEVIVTFDPSTFKVSVDPEAVTVNNAISMPDGQARIEALKPGFCEMIKTGVTQALAPRYTGSRHLDDVKVKKGALLKFEIADVDYTFTATPKQ